MVRSLSLPNSSLSTVRVHYVFVEVDHMYPVTLCSTVFKRCRDDVRVVHVVELMSISRCNPHVRVKAYFPFRPTSGGLTVNLYSVVAFGSYE